MLAVQSSTASYVHFCVFSLLALLVTGFNPAWFGHYGFLEDEELVRQTGEKHLRCEPFGWCSERRLRHVKMGHVTCRYMLSNVGSMVSSEPRVPLEGLMRGWEGLRWDRLTALFFLLLAVEQMLEPLLLSCEKTLATKIGVVF
jgi:hypothetical protein